MEIFLALPGDRFFIFKPIKTRACIPKIQAAERQIMAGIYATIFTRARQMFAMKLPEQPGSLQREREKTQAVELIC
ncbi:hypothetical protein [Propionivibrio sp.]|uniref:hypothetical protein n=1 Tax=Propionivibrio sp. TaxID=2212460 RepID=UPI003BF10F7F